MKGLKILSLLVLTGSLVSCGTHAGLRAKVAELEEELKGFRDERKVVASNLALFDKLDLEAFNNRDWDLIKQIHTEDVTVYNPDGSVSRGMTPEHERDLQFLFDTFPDFKINSHPIGFGSGEWTAGMSVCTGTFSAPMKLPDGTVIEPTGKKFEIRVATLARWRNGRIVEEYLFWDNLAWLRQIGAIK